MNNAIGDGADEAGKAEPGPVAETARGDHEQQASVRGMRQLAAQEFDVLDSMGGVRGLIETVAPGLVFVVIFVATNSLMPSLVASIAVAVVATIARLATSSSPLQAVSGLAGVGIGALWAWRSGDASNFYAWGLLVNAAWVVAVVISIAVRWPIVGVITSTLFQHGHGWRREPLLRKRYTVASWLWAGAFALRLVVQTPLYFGSQVGWLGTARLVMGLPMWALVLWITWLLVRPQANPATEQGSDPHPK